MLTDVRQTNEYCPRESALSWKHAIDDETRWMPTAERLTYDIGDFLQKSVTQRLHAHLIGDWDCMVCGNEWRGTYKLCDCGAVPAYHEVYLRGPETGVMGSLDLLLDLDFPKAVVTEVKSIEKDKFKELAMPLIEHRYRVIGYLRLLQEVAKTDEWIAENVELTFGYVLYISKGYGKYFKHKEGGVGERFSPFQEFLIRDEGNPAKDVDEKFKRASAYWFWRKHQDVVVDMELPKRIFNCTGPESKRGKKCIAAKECWA